MKISNNNSYENKFTFWNDVDLLYEKVKYSKILNESTMFIRSYLMHEIFRSHRETS